MNQPKSNALQPHLSKLFGRINFERQIKIPPRAFRLQNMTNLLGRLGDPHLDYPVVHVAGTKGKGSVTSMIGAILTRAGYKTGVHTSPHLESFNQRMAIDGRPISDDELLEVLRIVEPAAEQLDRELEQEGFRSLTYFEVSTACMFLYFSRHGVDLAVVEVGMGGRLDSTNICQPALSIITNISLDHTRQLGNTLEAIATEKAGIIKPGVPVVSGAIAPAAEKVIRNMASERSSDLFLLERDFGLGHAANKYPDATFRVCGDLYGRSFEVDRLSLNVIGEHQRINAAIAVTAVRLLDLNPSLSVPVSDQAIRDGLQVAGLPGRTEIVQVNLADGERTLLIDIAHNPASIEALVAAIHHHWPHRLGKKKIVFAASRDKDFQQMLKPLVQEFDHIIITRYRDNPRGAEISELAAVAKAQAESVGSAVEIDVCNTPDVALETALDRSRTDDLLVIAGSAFLVAELRPQIMARRDSGCTTR